MRYRLSLERVNSLRPDSFLDNLLAHHASLAAH
jgi:hypothetical protein